MVESGLLQSVFKLVVLAVASLTVVLTSRVAPSVSVMEFGAILSIWKKFLEIGESSETRITSYIAKSLLIYLF